MAMSNPIENRILIVDDEPSVLDILSQYLRCFYDCMEADSAENALAITRNQSFAVVLTDVMLPGMNGLELIRRISENSPDTVFLAISGAKTVDQAVKALKVGVFDYIQKPFELKEVEKTVERAFERYRAKMLEQRYGKQLEYLVEQRTAELNQALEEIEDSYRAIEASYRATVKALVDALETRVFETYGHSERVVTYSLRLGIELGLDEPELQALEFGALLHDIGKIGIPDSILRKPGALDEEEWQKMFLHPLHGEKILRHIPYLEGASKVVAQHHEKWNGRGYPLGLRGAEIDFNARIFAVVDAFDALTSDLIYRDGVSYEDASMEIDRCSGTQFDPHIVEAFHQIPPPHWEELFRLSWMKKTEPVSFRRLVEDVMKNTPAAKTEIEFQTAPEAVTA